jgi:hypothetical protein
MTELGYNMVKVAPEFASFLRTWIFFSFAEQHFISRLHHQVVYSLQLVPAFKSVLGARILFTINLLDVQPYVPGIL